jgi:hypothetical protein
MTRLLQALPHRILRLQASNAGIVHGQAQTCQNLVERLGMQRGGVRHGAIEIEDQHASPQQARGSEDESRRPGDNDMPICAQASVVAFS